MLGIVAQEARPLQRLAILTYHSIDDSHSPLSTSPSLFARQLECLGEIGAHVLSLHEAVAKLAASELPARAVAITFDDGFRNFHRHALALLARHGFPATVFVVTDFVGRDNAWPGQPAWVARRPLLDWEELREIAQVGIDVGAHSRTHPRLRLLPPDEVAEEIAGAKHAIEQRIGRPVRCFAYPYGDYDDDVMTSVSRHVSVACTARLGFADRGSHPLALPRLDAYYLRRPWTLRGLFSQPLRAYVALRGAARELRRGIGR